WQPYFLRAIGKVGAKHPPGDALADFRRARFLEPNAYEVPYEEGIVWLGSDPNLAITAWREALRRAGPQRGEVYGRMLALATQYGPRNRNTSRVDDICLARGGQIPRRTKELPESLGSEPPFRRAAGFAPGCSGFFHRATSAGAPRQSRQFWNRLSALPRTNARGQN